MKRFLHKIYKKHIRGRIRNELHRQRLKLVFYDVFAYWRLMFLNHFSFIGKIIIIIKCIRIDWHILHGHKPVEIIPILLKLSERKAKDNELFIEAGCWMGGSSAKFSLICDKMGYSLEIYDSFEGVEPGDLNSPESHFYGTYVGPIEKVEQNLKKFGVYRCCKLHKGWFENTMKNFSGKVRMAYIDCDLSKGTLEVLKAVTPCLTDDGIIYTQDFHIISIRNLLQSENTWLEMEQEMPDISHVTRNLASIVLSKQKMKSRSYA